ncbi:DnaB-like helicase C-terminal domain-containing protein [Yeosuana sp. AK3]
MKSSFSLLNQYKSLNDININEDVVTGLNTGFPKFNKFTKGLQPGQLIVIAGRPGMGSVAFTRCVLLNTSIRYNNPIYIFSLENSAKFYLEKMIATEADMSYYRFSREMHSDDKSLKLNQSIEEIGKAPICIDDSLSFKMNSLIVRAREANKKGDIKLFVIHGYHLLTHKADSKLSREQELDVISQKLKHLAEDLNITLIITHELPDITNCNSDEDVKPSLKELYDDTPIAKYADLVTFLYRPEYYGFETWYDTDNSCECEAELIIAKNRHGYTNSFRLFVEAYKSRFSEIDDV